MVALVRTPTPVASVARAQPRARLALPRLPVHPSAAPPMGTRVANPPGHSARSTPRIRGRAWTFATERLAWPTAALAQLKRHFPPMQRVFARTLTGAQHIMAACGRVLMAGCWLRLVAVGYSGCGCWRLLAVAGGAWRCLAVLGSCVRRALMSGDAAGCRYSRFLGDGPWFAGQSLTACDFIMFELLDQNSLMVKGCRERRSFEPTQTRPRKP